LETIAIGQKDAEAVINGGETESIKYLKDLAQKKFKRNTVGM